MVHWSAIWLPLKIGWKRIWLLQQKKSDITLNQKLFERNPLQNSSFLRKGGHNVLLVCQYLSSSIFKVWFIASWKKCAATWNTNIALHHHFFEIKIFLEICRNIAWNIPFVVELLKVRFSWSSIQRKECKMNASYKPLHMVCVVKKKNIFFF